MRKPWLSLQSSARKLAGCVPSVLVTPERFRLSRRRLRLRNEHTIWGREITMELLIGYAIIFALYVLISEHGARNERARMEDERAAERMEWFQERRELVTRVSHPERIPVPLSGAPA